MKNKQKFFSKIVFSLILAVSIFGGYYAVAGFMMPNNTPPSNTPAESDQDFNNNIQGANNANNDYNSSAVVGNATGSIIERLQKIQDDYFPE